MGDPACHLSSICLSCGRFIDEPKPETCPHCGVDTEGRIGEATGPVFAAARINTILYCDAFEATADFYRRLLELEVTFSNEWFVEFRLADRSALSIADARRTTIPAVDGKGVTISLQVDDLDALRHRLADRGIETTAVSERFGSRVFDIHDPEGHRVEFWADRGRGS